MKRSIEEEILDAFLITILGLLAILFSPLWLPVWIVMRAVAWRKKNE